MRVPRSSIRRRHLVSIFVAALAVGAGAVSGCGLDDTGIVAADFSSSDASLLGDTGVVTGDAGGSGSDGAPGCTPKTCASYPTDCHSSLDDGCGKKIDCSGACPSGQACVAATGFCNGPPVCQDAGAPGGNCGTLVNPGNATLTTDCGNCSNTGYTCGTNTCGCAGTACGAVCCQTGSAMPSCNAAAGTCCKMKTCAADYASKCDPASDNGCGGTLDCSGNCSGGTTCDGTHNCCANAVCGGTCCTAGQVCNGTSCCTRDVVSTTCGGKCGTVTDNCGVPTSCGNCSGGDTCSGSANCTCGSASCAPGQICHMLGGDHCS